MWLEHTYASHMPPLSSGLLETQVLEEAAYLSLCREEQLQQLFLSSGKQIPSPPSNLFLPTPSNLSEVSLLKTGGLWLFDFSLPEIPNARNSYAPSQLELKGKDREPQQKDIL